MELEEGFYRMKRVCEQSRFVEEAREVASHGLLLARSDVRPWGEFLEAFALPKADATALTKRVLVNMLYYRVNYSAAASAVVLALAALRGWALVPVALGAVVQAFYLFHYKGRRNPLTVAGHLFEHREKLALFGWGVALTAFMAGAFVSVAVTVVAVAGLVGTHAALRPRSSRSKFSSLGVDMETGAPGPAAVGFSDFKFEDKQREKDAYAESRRAMSRASARAASRAVPVPVPVPVHVPVHGLVRRDVLSVPGPMASAAAACAGPETPETKDDNDRVEREAALAPSAVSTSKKGIFSDGPKVAVVLANRLAVARTPVAKKID